MRKTGNAFYKQGAQGNEHMFTVPSNMLSTIF